MAEETPEGHLVESMSAEEEASPNKNDGNEGTSSEESSLGRCLSTLISTIIQDFDNRAEHTLRSQDQLSFALHRLTAELDQLLDDAPLPFVMQHAARISGVRKRFTSLNSVLKSIQRRIDNIDRTLSAASLQDSVMFITAHCANIE
ncbi:uncharacterized protein LOC113772467 isoform X1 [Coffea eugenioides]|uniref:Biogenesis of lysosome-related organelles complex 1 subunit 7 n=1 Tax=Coffea arabica TaxID=13443 RepID=A0A6P6XHW2_COFAR|nr:uncharacterized protein LOC113743531 isoform X1 [Coffea arabica]XP_027172865.1 uncharacterized protein LOC113772467 isoform X1 [Coffea eugenioides]